MAQRGLQLDKEKLSCSICRDLLRDPVTIPCGHSYCTSCIKTHWNQEDPKSIYSCPQCRETFIPRPVLGKNTMLSELVEEMKEMQVQAASQPQCHAGAGDVECDFCIGRKLIATKSCLQCLASYCESHLKPHYDSPTFQKHKLVAASAKIQENICSRHSKVKEIFCRSDQESICYLCSVDEHKGHDTVSAAAERAERQRELGPARLNIQQRIQDREKEEKLLQQEVEATNSSADNAVRDSQTMFSQVLRIMEKRSSDVQRQIRSQQETELRQTKELQEKLKQEIVELRRTDAELEQLSHSENHCEFLLRFPSLLPLSPSTNSASIDIRPPKDFKELTVAVSAVTRKLQDILRREWIPLTDADALRTPAEPETSPSPRALLSASKILPPPTSLTPDESKGVPSPPVYLTPDKSKGVPSPPVYLTPDESKGVPSPPIYLTPDKSKGVPSPPIYLTPDESKGVPSPPIYPTPDESKGVPSPPIYLTPDESKGVPSPPIYLTPDKSKGVPSPPIYLTPDKSKGVPSPPIYLTPDESKGVPSPPIYLTPDKSKGVPSPPIYLTPDKSKGVPSPPIYLTPDKSKGVPSPPIYLTPDKSKGVPSPPIYLTPDKSKGVPSPPIYLTPDKSKGVPSPPIYPTPDGSKGVPSPPACLTPEECTNRADFLQYSCKITLDPNTVNKSLALSGQNTRVTRGKKKLFEFNHPERFVDRFQVLSKESLTGRCYWEVEWNGIVSVAVAYKNISRTGTISGFGDNNKSWALYCHNNKFIHNSVSTVLSGPHSSRVGVFLDHREGTLSFYSVSGTMNLLHRVQTTFTQPLHAGICVGSGSAELLQLL